MFGKTGRWCAATLASVFIDATGVIAQTALIDDCAMLVFFPDSGFVLNNDQNNRIRDFLPATSPTETVLVGYSGSDERRSNSDLRQRRVQAVSEKIISSGSTVSATELGDGGIGPDWRRVDILKQECALAVLPEAPSVVGLRPEVGIAALIGLIGVAAALSSTSDTQ